MFRTFSLQEHADNKMFKCLSKVNYFHLLTLFALGQRYMIFRLLNCFTLLNTCAFVLLPGDTWAVLSNLLLLQCAYHKKMSCKKNISHNIKQKLLSDAFSREYKRSSLEQYWIHKNLPLRNLPKLCVKASWF